MCLLFIFVSSKFSFFETFFIFHSMKNSLRCVYMRIVGFSCYFVVQQEHSSQFNSTCFCVCMCIQKCLYIHIFFRAVLLQFLVGCMHNTHSIYAYNTTRYTGIYLSLYLISISLPFFTCTFFGFSLCFFYNSKEY